MSEGGRHTSYNMQKLVYKRRSYIQESDAMVWERRPRIVQEQVKEIEKDTTYREIVELLGPTVDIGSGLHVLRYEFENGDDFLLSVPQWDTRIDKTGEELLEQNVKTQ